MLDLSGEVFLMASMGISVFIQADGHGVVLVARIPPYRSSLVALLPRFRLSNYFSPNGPRSFDHHSSVKSDDLGIRRIQARSS